MVSCPQVHAELLILEVCGFQGADQDTEKLARSSR